MSRFRWRRGRSHPAGPDASYFLRPPALALPYVGSWSGGPHASSHSMAPRKDSRGYSARRRTRRLLTRVKRGAFALAAHIDSVRPISELDLAPAVP